MASGHALLAHAPLDLSHCATVSRKPSHSATNSSSSSTSFSTDSSAMAQFEPYRDDVCRGQTSIQPSQSQQLGLGIGLHEASSQHIVRRATVDAGATMLPTTASMLQRHGGQNATNSQTPIFELPPTPSTDSCSSKEWPQAGRTSPMALPSTPGKMERVNSSTSAPPQYEATQSSVTMPSPAGLPAGPTHRAEAPVAHSQWVTAREIASLGELPYLNGIRALASIMIQVYHIYDEDARYISFFASAALATHFVQGGFLITSSLLSLQSRARNKGWAHMHEHVPQFFMGRWARLYPALLVVIVLNSIWWLNRHDMPMHLTKLITRTLLKLQHTDILDVGDDPPNPFAHTWFLDVQEQFYLFWSLALPMVAMLPVAGRLTVLGSLFSWSFRARLKTDRENATLRINLYKMVAGCAVQLIPFPRFLIHRHVRIFVIAFILAFLAYGFSPRLNDGLTPPYQRLYGDNAGVVLVTLLTLAGISKKQEVVDAKAQAAQATTVEARRNYDADKEYSTLAQESHRHLEEQADDDDEVCGISTSWLRKLEALSPLSLLDSHLLQFVGRISYSWYLWQIPLMHFEDTFHVGSKAIGTSAEAFIVAMISTFYIEEPVRNVYQAMRRRQRAAALGLPSTSRRD